MKNTKTFGLLYPGDMGMAIAKILIANNFRVISVSKGRSENTKNNIRNSEIEDAENLEQLVNESDYILGLTSPKTSLQIAEQVAEIISLNYYKPIFVDLNSNSPEIASEIEKTILKSGAKFINGAVMGASQDIPKNAVIVVSGDDKEEFIELLKPMFRVKDAGKNSVAASAYKLLFSMVNKGMNALFFETMIAAAHFGILDELNESLQNYLPGTYEDLKKTTPTYPQHIERRISEMQGLVTMLKKNDLPDGIAHSSADTFEKVFHSGIFEGEKPVSVTETFEYFKKLK